MQIKYNECTLEIESVDTINVRLNWHTVLTVCTNDQVNDTIIKPGEIKKLYRNSHQKYRFSSESQKIATDKLKLSMKNLSRFMIPNRNSLLSSYDTPENNNISKLLETVVIKKNTT